MVATPVKISDLPTGSALQGPEIAAFVQTGATVKITANQIETFVVPFAVGPYGAVGNGATDDTTAINAAGTAAGVAGGVLQFQAGKTYVTSALISIPQKVNIEGNGAAVLLGTATHFFSGVTNDFSSQQISSSGITINPTVGTNTLTVASGAAFSIGQHVAISAGDDVTDVTTPALACTANIINIVGNVLTLDRIFTYAITPVGSSHSTVFLYPQYQNDLYFKDIFLEGNGNTPISSGFTFYYSENLKFENITGNSLGGLNMGFGLITAFWSENIICKECTLYHNENTGVGASLGRMYNFAGCRNVYIYDSECQDTHNSFAFIEGHSQNVNFFNSSIRHYNNPNGQVLFACDLSQIYVENTYIELPNTYDVISLDTSGSTFTSARFRNLTLRGIMPRLMPSYPDVTGRVDFSDGTHQFVIDLDDIKEGQLTVPLAANMNNNFFFPFGLMVDVWVYVSPDVDLTQLQGSNGHVFLGTSGNNGQTIDTSLVVGNWVQISPNGAGGIFGTGGNMYSNTTRLGAQAKTLIQSGTDPKGYISFFYRMATFVVNSATTLNPFPDTQATFFGTALGAPKLQSGVHSVTSGEATATTVSFSTGLDTITTINVQILRSGVNVTSTAVISASGGVLTVANGAGYTMTTGDKINWMVVA